MNNKDSPSWFRPRGYLHFDVPITKQRAIEIATNPAEVVKHAFFPLVSYAIRTVKARRDNAGSLVKTTKIRPIRYAAHVDSHIYSYYSQGLAEIYERELGRKGLSDCVLAFRTLGASNIEFAARAFERIRELGPCRALAFDVTGFFDNIAHGVLKRRWSSLLGCESLPADHYAVFRSLTKYSFVDREKVYAALGISAHNPKNGRRRICSPEEFRSVVREGKLVEVNKGLIGIPQGTPISALLSNVYLLEFDAILDAEAKMRGGFYYRYCDDILLVVPKADESLEALVNGQLKLIGLEANPKKTEKSHFVLRGGGLHSSRPLQYLGFIFDGQRVLVRSAALAKFSGRMKKGVKLAKATSISRNKERLEQGRSPKVLYRRKLYERYSHLGRRNFIRYALRAADEMNSSAIRRQLRPLWARLKREIEEN